MHPAISICIPAYNQPANLKRLLESIDIQEFRDFEVIVTDDSPTDILMELINFKWSFPIKYHRNEIALGSPANWNSAIGKANGTWIKLMHHDDWFENPESLQSFYDATLENSDAKFFFSSTYIYDTIEKKKFLYVPNQERYKKLISHPVGLFHANVIGAPTTILSHRDIKMLYNTDLIWLVDIEYYVRVMKEYGITKIEKPLIVTSSKQAHQLTSSLVDKKEVELYECLYCYNELKPQLNQENRALFAQRILFVLQQFKVKSTSEITSAGYKGPMPLFISIYCFLAKLNQTLAVKVLGKWNQLQLN